MDKIYFMASIRGGREDVDLYDRLIEHLKQYRIVLTEHIGDKNLSILGEEGLTDKKIHDRDMDWLNQSKFVIAEVTTASLGVGYELGRIVERNSGVSKEEKKKILCLYRPEINKKLSAMITGCSGLINVNYETLEEAKKAINEFFLNE
jgi:2'-deoxynucleoside 5'-phosphate N-hydrolase